MNASEWRMRWTTQVCTCASGKTAVIASGKPFRPSTMAISTSSTPRLFTPGSSPGAEFGALGLFDPKSQDFLRPVRADAERDIDRLVSHRPFVAHLDADGIEEDQRIKSFERPVLPVRHLVEDGVGDGADEIGGDVDPVELTQMPLDLADAHAALTWVSSTRQDDNR